MEQKQCDGSRTFEAVDDYVVVEVLANLAGNPRDLANFGATCRRMRRVVMSHPAELWQFADPATLSRSSAGRTALAPVAGTLTLSELLTTKEEGLELVRRMPNLRTLRHEVRSAHETIACLLESLKSSNLVSLSLRNCRTVSHELPKTLESMSDLQHLHLRECNTETFVSAWESAPQGLQSLRACSDDVCWSDQLASLPAKGNLLQLRLDSRAWDSQKFDCSCLSRCCPNLTSLHVRVGTTSSTIQSLSGLKHLRDLSLVLDWNGGSDPLDRINDQGYEHLGWSSALDVSKAQYGSMETWQKNLAWHGGVATQLGSLANAKDCEPFESVRIEGGRVDLSGFFGGRRCRGQLSSMELWCWVPESCSEVIADSCGKSLRKVTCPNADCFLGPLTTLLSRPEAQRPLLQEVCLCEFDGQGLSLVAGLLKDSTTVTSLQVVSDRFVMGGLSVLKTSLPRLKHLKVVSRSPVESDLEDFASVVRDLPHIDQISLDVPVWSRVPGPRGLPSNAAFSRFVP